MMNKSILMPGPISPELIFGKLFWTRVFPTPYFSPGAFEMGDHFLSHEQGK